MRQHTRTEAQPVCDCDLLMRSPRPTESMAWLRARGVRARALLPRLKPGLVTRPAYTSLLYNARSGPRVGSAYPERLDDVANRATTYNLLPIGVESENMLGILVSRSGTTTRPWSSVLGEFSAPEPSATGKGLP